MIAAYNWIKITALPRYFFHFFFNLNPRKSFVCQWLVTYAVSKSHDTQKIGNGSKTTEDELLTNYKYNIV